MRRAEIRWYRFRAPDKRRPILILTRTPALSFLTGIVVASITSTVRDIPSEVLLTPDEDGVQTVCAVNLDNVYTVEKSKVGTVISALSPHRMQEVDWALCFALGIDINLLA